jgi:uncharacterized protein (TIGR00255 family)
MLLSMTGIGEARVDTDTLSVAVELRSVNNRHLKVSVRGPEAYLSLEHEVEKLIRSRIARGTVTVQLRITREAGGAAYALSPSTLREYVRQLRDVHSELGLPPVSDVSPLLALPGVLVESNAALLDQSDWPVVSQTLNAALDRLHEFRVREGEAMARDLIGLCGTLDANTAEIAVRAPLVVDDYRQRLQDRIGQVLGESGLQLNPGDLIREVGLFADRSDINEELTRLRCHLEQFRALVHGSESAGRTMEFLCQELNREINTIGSKANDVEIARRVVECKGAIERIREIVQNVE